MKSSVKPSKPQTRKQFITGWFPVGSPSTQALIWRSATASGGVFVAEITRRGEKIGELKAETAEELAGLLSKEIGPSPKSLVRLTGAAAVQAMQ